MNKYLKEAVLWVLIAIPFVYLATIWAGLPDKVPTHFNSEGNPNDWSRKTSLIFITGATEIGIYLLMLLKVGNIHYKVRFLMTLFISLLMTYCIYLSKVGVMKNPF